MSLKFRRGLDLARSTIPFDEGEPIWTTDTNKLYIGKEGVDGGVLVNPSISVDSDVDPLVPDAAVTVIVDRSRSRFDTEDAAIDLRTGNNFNVSINTAPNTLSFLDASLTGNISDGQSGYIIITTDPFGTIDIAPQAPANPNSPAIFTIDGGTTGVSSSTSEFVSYVVLGAAVYLSNATVRSSAP